MPAIPEWFEGTPDETSYELAMFGPLGGALQEVTLTREEYVALKAYLGAVRGFGYQAQLAELKTVYLDYNQAAQFIEGGREAIEQYPALVHAQRFPVELQEFLDMNTEVAHA